MKLLEIKEKKEETVRMRNLSKNKKNLNKNHRVLEINEHSGGTNQLNLQLFQILAEIIYQNHYKNVKGRNSFKYNKISKKGSKDSNPYPVNESNEFRQWLEKKSHPHEFPKRSNLKKIVSAHFQANHLSLGIKISIQSPRNIWKWKEKRKKTIKCR